MKKTNRLSYIMEDSNQYAFIYGLYIVPKERGQGKARALMQNILDEISEEYPNAVIELYARPGEEHMDPDRLIRFYEDFGFKIIRQIWDDTFLMRKE